MSRNCGVSGQGPSSNVSATTCRAREPFATNGGPLATQPASFGVCSVVRAGFAGNSVVHPNAFGFGGVHAGGRRPLSTCQRSVLNALPISAGAKLAVRSLPPDREIVAEITVD